MSFRVKLTLLASVLGVAPLVALGVVLVGTNQETIERGVWQLQIALADDVARSLEGTLRERDGTLRAIAEVLGDPSVPEDARLATMRALVEADEGLDHVAVFGREGEHLDTLREDGAEVLEALDQEVRVVDGEVRIPRAIAIEGGGATTGWVASAVSLAPLRRRLLHLTQSQLATLEGTLYVVDDEGRILAHPEPGALGERVDASVLTGFDPATSRGPRSGERVTAGVELVATTMPLEGAPWAVVVEVPRAHAYADLRRARTSVAVSVTVTSLLALLFAAWMARRITAPIATLSAFARDLAARRFDRRVSLATGDELETLGEDLSATAAALEESEERIREEHAIRADLGRYLPAELVEKIAMREQDMALGGRRLPISVLFADVVAFTPLSERLPPEDVVALLNELFTVLTEVVFRHGGTVDKFVGDAVMALWGAPEPREDHARAALRAAEDMLAFVETASGGWEARFGVRIDLAIGVHSGEAVVGNVGSERRMEYTAIGDVVNLAARLEAVARPKQILVSAATRELAGDEFDYADAGAHELSGRARPVQLFEVRP